MNLELTPSASGLELCLLLHALDVSVQPALMGLCNKDPFFFFDHAVWLLRSEFPDEGLNLGHSSESTNSLPLDHQGAPTNNCF